MSVSNSTHSHYMVQIRTTDGNPNATFDREYENVADAIMGFAGRLRQLWHDVPDDVGILGNVRHYPSRKLVMVFNSSGIGENDH